MHRGPIILLPVCLAWMVSCAGATEPVEADAFAADTATRDATAADDASGPVDLELPAVVTWSVVQPVYLRNCGGCHGGQGRGGTDFAINYEDTLGESDSCAPDHLLRPLRVAACAVERVDGGTMPPGDVKVSEADAEIMRRYLSSGLSPE